MSEDEDKIEETVEESGLEEDLKEEDIIKIVKSIEENEPDKEISDSEFQSFMQPTISEIDSSPVLEKVAEGSSMAPIGNLGKTNQFSDTSTGSDDPFKYESSMTSQQDDKSKYMASDSKVIAEQQRVDFQNVGRSPNPIDRQNLFVHSPEASQVNPSMQEKYETAQRLDTEQVGRKDFLKREEKQYKANLPKS